MIRLVWFLSRLLDPGKGCCQVVRRKAVFPWYGLVRCYTGRCMRTHVAELVGPSVFVHNCAAEAGFGKGRCLIQVSITIYGLRDRSNLILLEPLVGEIKRKMDSLPSSYLTMSGSTNGVCHGSDFALTPPPVNSGHVQHLAPIRRTSSIFQHHSDPIPATPIAEITASPSSRIRLLLLPSHPLVSFTVPLSRPISIQHAYLHTPFIIHLAICLGLLFP
jgi:hypothetical protein